MSAIGKETCIACRGDGGAWCPLDWLRCQVCDGLGEIWRTGGPRFGAPHVLGDLIPGQIVEFATGHRARVLWHMPRKNPETTFVGLLDDFDDTEASSATPVDSALGVVSAAPRVQVDGDRDAHDGEKDADDVDPIARRKRQAAGPLL